MKKFIFLLFIFINSSLLFAQDWFSLSTPWSSTVDIQNITVDRNTNTIVYNTLFQFQVLKGDGTSFTVGMPGHSADYNSQGLSYFNVVYYHNDRVYAVCESSNGLKRMTFEPSFKDTVLYEPGLRDIFIDEDTLWLSGSDPNDARKLTNEFFQEPFTMGSRSIIKYKGKVWGRSVISHHQHYGIIYHDGSNYVQFNILNSNILSDSVYGFCTNTENGIMFVGTAQGLSQFNGVDFTNITPTTHPDMPYKTVLDVEYDHRNGKLWMVLGDDNLVAKTLTSFDGNWESFDASSSPIDFDKFVDMVVDTLGQVWVAEENELHILNTNELEGWLAVEKQNQKEIQVNVFPNPSDGLVDFQWNIASPVSIHIYNIQGQLIYTKENLLNNIQLELPKGLHYYTIRSNNNFLKTGKIVVK